MKKTVRIISAVCAIVMLLGMLPVMSIAAGAASTPVVMLDVSSGSIKAGREFTVTARLANNPGLWAIAFELAIDPEVFEFVKADLDSSIFKRFGSCDYDQTTNSYKYNSMSLSDFENVTVDGTLVTLTLRAKADAELGKHMLYVDIYDENTLATKPKEGGAANEYENYLVAVSESNVSFDVVANVAVSTIKSAQVKLGTDISVSYFVNLDEDHAGAQMKFTFNEEETVVDGVATGVGNEYEYVFAGIAPQCMGDNLKAELIYDGDVVATKDEYSILANCQNLLAKSAAELGLTNAQYAAMETLIADLLVYGAKAQIYRDYKTEALVDAGVTGATTLGEIAASNDIKYTEGSSSATVAFTAAGVFFDYANSLYYKFTAPEMTADNFKLVFVTYDEGYNVMDSVTYTITDCELIDEATSTYKFRTDDISVLDYGTIYSVELYVKSGRNWGDPVQFLDYNVNSYAYAKQDTANTKMADLAKALYNYGVSAVAYLNA